MNKIVRYYEDSRLIIEATELKAQEEETRLLAQTFIPSALSRCKLCQTTKMQIILKQKLCSMPHTRLKGHAKPNKSRQLSIIYHTFSEKELRRIQIKSRKS